MYNGVIISFFDCKVNRSGADVTKSSETVYILPVLTIRCA